MRYDGRSWIHFSEPQLVSQSQTEHWNYYGPQEVLRSAILSGVDHTLNPPCLLMVGAFCWNPVARVCCSTPGVWYDADLPAGSVHLETEGDHQTTVLLSPSALAHTHTARGLFLEEGEDPYPYP